MSDEIAGRLALTELQVEAMSAHARAEYPNECCGLLLGPSEERAKVSEVIAVPNIQDRLHAEDPAQYPRDARTAYAMDPGAQVRALRDGEARGLALRGFYHSHPDHGVYFSEEDRRLAAPWGEPLFDGIAYVVLSVSREGVAGASQFVWDLQGSDYVEIAIAALDARIDLRGKTAPQALITARDALRRMRDGGLLEVLADDRTSADDSIPGYCEKRRYPYELERDAATGTATIRIRKPR